MKQQSLLLLVAPPQDDPCDYSSAAKVALVCLKFLKNCVKEGNCEIAVACYYRVQCSIFNYVVYG